MNAMVKLGLLAAAVCLPVAACHVGGGYTVGGTVTGVRGSGMVIEDNSGNALTVVGNGTFQFASGIDQGGAYSVTITTQPSGQTCVVRNGAGTIGTADIDNVVITCSLPGLYAYVANMSSNSISAFAIDASTGALTPVADSPFASAGTTPVAAVVDPNGTYLYVANNASNNLSVYAIDASTGALSEVGEPVPTGNGPFAVLVDPHNQFVYVANKTDNTVSVYSIASGGALSEIGGSPFAVGEEPASLAIDPGGNFLYVTSYAGGSIYAFSIEPGAGAIAAIGGSPFGAGAGALSIAIDPTGTYAYVANESGHSISLYSIDTGTGALAALSGSPIATQTQPESLVVDPAGRFLFAADVTAGNDLSSYSITPSSGALTLASSAVAGDFPLGVAVNPAGTFVYVANENSNDVSAYSIDATTGALTAVKGSPFAAGGDSRSITID
jgi:6-phosphogluconolactonase